LLLFPRVSAEWGKKNVWTKDGEQNFVNQVARGGRSLRDGQGAGDGKSCQGRKKRIGKNQTPKFSRHWVLLLVRATEDLANKE